MAPPRKRSKLPVLKESYDERSLYDWMSVRTEFIEGVVDEDGVEVWPTIKELAVRHNIPEKSLTNRVTQERWKDYRVANQNRIMMERQKERAKLLAGKAVKFDETTVTVAELGLKLVAQRFDELAELDPTIRANRELIITAAEVDGKPFRVSDVKASALSGAELESLSKAAALFVEIGRKGYGTKDGEPATQHVNIQVNQGDTTITQQLMRPDEDRAKEFMRILGNKNISIPGLTGREEIVEGEIVDEEENEDDD